MKLKTLLVLVASMFMSLSAFADWTKPTIQGSTPENGGEYYIMNVEAGQFLNNAKVWFSWGTSAGLDDAGQVSMVVDNGDGTWNIARTSDGKYTFISGNGVTGKQEMHVDGASATAFSFTKQSSGYYYITIAQDEYAGTSWGWLGTSHTYVNAIYADIVPAEAPTAASCEWAFVTAEEKAAFAPKMAAYTKALELKEVLDEAESKGVNVDEEKAVYNNEDSSAEELQAAIESVNKKIMNAAAALATLENPADMTAKIINSTFDKVGDFTGWKGSSWGAGGSTSTCAERYQMTFDTWQQIDEMPIGVYKVNVDGFYRAGGAADDFAAEEAGNTYNPAVYGANVVADTISDIASSYIMHLSHGIKPNDPDGLGGMAVTYKDESYNVPNSMVDFVRYNQAGYYKTNSVLFPVSEGTLKIGVKNNSSLGWTIVDNFGLTYYGNGADAWGALMSNYKENCALSSDLTVTGSVAEAFDAAVQAAQATDYESYKAAAAAIAEAKAAVDENVAAWAEYAKLAAQAQKLIDDPKYSEIAVELSDYLAYDYDDNLNALELTTEEIKAEIEKLKNLYEDAKALTPPGTDVSGMLQNSDFADGWTGWEHSGTGGAVAVNKSAKCAEAWNSANFDIHQDIENAPVGVYEIQVQGFYRYLRGDNAWNEYFSEDGTKKEDPIDYIKNTPAKIFINDNTSPMANVFDYSVNPEYAAEKWTANNYYTDPLGEKCYPNNMTDAGNAFDLGQYSVSAFGLVAKKGDPLRVGIKGNSNQGGDSWAIFTRFKMIYQGYKAEIIKPELEKEIAAMNLESAMGSDVVAEAQAAVEAGQAALESGDGQEMFKALSAIYAIKEKVSESVALFEKLTTKAGELEEKMNDNEASDAANEEAATLLAEIQAGVEGGEYTNANAEEKIKEIDAMLLKLDIPADVEDAIANASDENPAEVTCFIVNPSFETGNINGWTVNEKATGDTDAHLNSNDTYHFENADGEWVFNTWNSSAVEDGFWVKQTVKNDMLPEGTYELKCVVASDAGNELKVSVNEKSVIDTPANGEDETEAKKIGDAVSVIFKLAEAGQDINIAVESSFWFKADNFQLFYYGKNSSKGEATGISDATTANPVRLSKKFMQNGQVVILKNGKKYSVLGIEIK